GGGGGGGRGAGCPRRGRANMESVSDVLEGGPAHRDDNGGEGVLGPGELQWMGAGHGIGHSEFNASKDAPLHFLQIWIQPDRVNAPPAHAQQAFDPQARRGRWATLASPDGAAGSLAIRQQAWLHGVRLGEGESAAFALRPDRRYWLHLARGAAEVNGRPLSAGDAIGYVGEAGELHLEGAPGETVADVLLFDLPA